VSEKSLGLLLRLAQREEDEKAREIREREDTLAQAERALLDHDAAEEAERRFAQTNTDALGSLQAFLRWSAQRRAPLLRTRDDAQAAVNAAREAITDAFRRRRTLEAARDNEIARLRREEARRGEKKSEESERIRRSFREHPQKTG